MKRDRFSAPTTHCEYCGEGLTNKQGRFRQRFCSVECQRDAPQPASTRNRILEVLRERGGAETTGALLEAVYGFAGKHEKVALRTAIFRMRARGYRVSWANGFYWLAEDRR
jgi:hypothetical protein